MAAVNVCDGQGRVNFINGPSSTVNAPISYSDGTNVDGTLHPTARAAVYIGPDGASESQSTNYYPKNELRLARKSDAV